MVVGGLAGLDPDSAQENKEGFTRWKEGNIWATLQILRTIISDKRYGAAACESLCA
jgi:hypothetical protein